ncbi:MAG TPA: ATP-binding protein [Pirellulales bacterium]|nr:ATP-binding protein [Pirellulales bacterium]
MPSLFVFRGNDQGVRFELPEGATTLGRDTTSAIQLHDHEVSRRHAVIRRVAAMCTVTDQASSNGTFVNGRRVESHVMSSGDELQVGGTQMLFTGVPEGSTDNLEEHVDIVARHHADDKSRIVRTISHEEGSRLFDMSADLGQSPWLARARSNLQVMYRTALAVSHTLDIDQLLNRIMQLIFEWVEADRGVIMLANIDTSDLEPRVRRTRQGIRDDKITISKTILDYVAGRNEGVLTSDAQDDARWNPAASILHLGIREAICVPMQGRYHTVGVIYIDTSVTPQQMASRNTSSKFSEEHLKLMIAIAHQAALAVEDTRYYSAMVQAERLAAVGQTIASLSHHIKNILQGIRGGSYLIKEGLAHHDENMVGKGWQFVEKNQDRISNLVMDMLTFSKDREPELVASDLNRVVSEVTELMQARARERQVELVLHAAAQVPSLTFDPEGMHRAILNLVTNAIDACDPATCEKDNHAGRVEITTELDRSTMTARVTVVDNGSGIASDKIDEIFTLFSSTKGGRGTGLGLPVSQKILKEHGGRLRVESEVGRGSRFIAEFPAALAEPPRTVPLPDAGVAADTRA